MLLKDLLVNLQKFEVYGDDDVRIQSIVDDSRKAKKGSLFVAIVGLTVDGHKFINNVIESGSVCVVGERKPKKSWLGKITYIQVDNSRLALSLIASCWYGNPSKKLKVIGITGTEGKTTTASLIYHLLVDSRKPAGLVSTISAKIGKKEYATGLHVTNPEPLELQKYFSQMVKRNCEYAVIEVTSHGLDQHRVSGIDFDIAALTNITHDHLDYHKTWEAYRDAKCRLFHMARRVVLNRDDKSYGYIESRLKNKSKIYDYSLFRKGVSLLAKKIHLVGDRMEFEVVEKNKVYSFDTALLGKFNVSNILAAVQVARMLKIPMKHIQKAISTFEGVKGRLEKLSNTGEFEVYIDFSHKPGSLREVLGFLRGKAKGRLICVVGCVGERDTKKRPMMGGIATSLADVSVFTADDPRSEDVNKIISQMVGGVNRAEAREVSVDRCGGFSKKSGKHIFLRIPERGEAIAFAIQKVAERGDIVAVCGKGHEQSLPYNGVEYPWSDHDAVRIALKGGVKRIKRK